MSSSGNGVTDVSYRTAWAVEREQHAITNRIGVPTQLSLKDLCTRGLYFSHSCAVNENDIETGNSDYRCSMTCCRSLATGQLRCFQQRRLPHAANFWAEFRWGTLLAGTVRILQLRRAATL